MRRILLCALLIAPLAAPAAPEPALEPLAFLAGHCWKGSLPNSTATDEHCFAWVYEGKFLRDRHVVSSGDKVTYEGETLYFWNAAARRLEYLYITNHGGYSQGSASPEGDAIVFPAAALVSEGKTYRFRGRWKRMGDDAYEVLREYETDKGWMPVRMEMKKVGGADPSVPNC